ncbi:MAG TPA: DUF5654 family protein [Patescibacteria group bacterium]|nr:DUF5654 family protein [Patescibacteria group bacterium]
MIMVMEEKIMQRTVGYIIAAFGLVAGLAWNDAIKALIDYLFPLSSGSLFAKFIYALLVTLAVVVATTYLMRMTKSSETDS